MPPSPSKRRKFDNSQSQTDDAVPNNGQPTTPTRASYLSPTKSSLARSHPHLVTHSTRRSTTEPRGKALRDEILNRTAQPSEAPNTVSRISHFRGFDGTDDSTTTQADENLPERESNGSAQDSTTANAGQSTESERLPLKERQPAQERIRQSSASSEEPAPPVILPKLVPRKETGARPVPRARSGEPDLPPTPVELGLSPAPEPPRDEQRITKTENEVRRTRHEQSTQAQSPSPAELVNEGDESTQDDVQEAPESEPEEAQQESGEPLAEVREQQSTLASLREQLENLKQENQQLQAAIDDDDDLSPETLTMLRQFAVEIGSVGNLKYRDKGDEMFAHLTLFAPGDLQLTNRTETKVIKDRTKIIHVLRVEAPPPWLPDTLSCAFEVVVDAENAQVEDIKLKEAISKARRTKSVKAEMYHWVNDRLEHPLHQLDVGGLIWGMGRWFNAAIERAKILQWIDSKYNRISLEDGKQKEKEDQEELSRDNCIELVRYLDMTQNSAIDADLTITSGGAKFRKKVMLTWNINLDWAGGLTSDIQISTSGIPKKAEPGLRAIFCDLAPRIGVKGAFQNVWSLIHSESGEFGPSSAIGKGKRKQ